MKLREESRGRNIELFGVFFQDMSEERKKRQVIMA